MSNSQSDLLAQLEALKAENARLKGGKGKEAPASVKNGVIHFPGISSLYGLNLNPDAFQSLLDRLPPIVAYFKANEAAIRLDYAARPAYEPKSKK